MSRHQRRRARAYAPRQRAHGDPGRFVGPSSGDLVREGMAQLLDRLPETVTVAMTLERCVCGQCFDCPDGWHWGDDVPRSCTPDCVLNDEGDR